MLLIALGWVVWPYYAFYDLSTALREGDVARLENRVAWDSVRQGLRDDLNALFLQTLAVDATSSTAAVGAGLAALLGPAVIDRMVDAYLTPQAIATLIKAGKSPDATIGPPPAASANREPLDLPNPALRQDLNLTPSPPQQFGARQVKYAFFYGGPFTFKVDVVPENAAPDQHPITLIFKWSGDWRLARLVLPPESFKPSAADIWMARTANDRMPIAAQPRSLPEPGRFTAEKSALPDKRAPQRPAATGVIANSTPSLGARAGNAPQLSQREIEGLQRQLHDCWAPPEIVLQAKGLVVTVRFSLNRDGSLAGEPVVVNRENGYLFQVAAESVVRAVRSCQPFRLPIAKYEAWKELEPDFKPEDKLGG
jgi:hypothetical protein